LVIDSTTAASPATFRAMSAMTVKVDTALNCACAVADMAMSKVAKIAPIAATTFERPWFTGISASSCAFDFRSDKRVLPQMRTICKKVCSLSRPGVCQFVIRWRYGLEVRPGRGHAGAFWKRLGADARGRNGTRYGHRADIPRMSQAASRPLS